MDSAYTRIMELKKYLNIFMAAFASLSQREREILSLVYGLSDGKRWTYRDIAMKKGISHGRVGQIVDKSRMKLEVSLDDLTKSIKDE